MSTSLFLCTLALVAALATPASAFGPRPDPKPVDDVDPMAVDPAVMDYLKQANMTSEGGNHLWFYWVSTNGQSSCQNGACRCGDIDAAARMPDELFKPQNLLALARYATLTIKSYSSLGMGSEKLKLGRCSQETKYTCGGGGVQGINWVTGALMGPICKKQCDCNYPSCQDQPDDPAAGKFCSLCGPKYNGYITINLWNLPNPDDDDQSSNYGPCGEQLTGSIVDVVAANPDLSTLYTALKAADLLTVLTAPGPWTLFAPSNKAFAALPPFALARLLKPKNKEELVSLLTYHVVPDSYCVGPGKQFCSRELKDGLTLRTEDGGKTVAVQTKYTGPPPYQSNVVINAAKIVMPDLRASDSVVHVLDTVLTPPVPNLVEVAVATPDLSTLVTALTAGDLVDLLSGPGPFTVFAPTNEAFAGLPAATLEFLLTPTNKEELVDVLSYHVVLGTLRAKDLKDRMKLTTVEGKQLTVRISGGIVFINSAKVTIADVTASNGVAHIIDGVLTP